MKKIILSILCALLLLTLVGCGNTEGNSTAHSPSKIPDSSNTSMGSKSDQKKAGTQSNRKKPMSADTFIKKMLSMGYIENCRESSDTQEYYRFEHPDYLAHNEVDVVYTIYKGVDFSTQLENFLEYRGYSNNPGIFAQGDNWFKYEDPDDELASFIVCIDNTELYITIDDADLDYAYEILEGLGY